MLVACKRPVGDRDGDVPFRSGDGDEDWNHGWDVIELDDQGSEV